MYAWLGVKIEDGYEMMFGNVRGAKRIKMYSFRTICHCFSHSGSLNRDPCSDTTVLERTSLMAACLKMFSMSKNSKKSALRFCLDFAYCCSAHLT